MDPAELEETWEETKDRPGAQLYLRQVLLCRMRGVVQDVGFAAEDVLRQAKRQLPDLEWEQEQRGPVRAVGKIRLQERRIALSLGGRRLPLTYALPCGLLEGLNRLLRDSGRPGRFVGLATDGDHYGYVWGDEALEKRMAASPLFKLQHDRDPLLGPP